MKKIYLVLLLAGYALTAQIIPGQPQNLVQCPYFEWPEVCFDLSVNTPVIIANNDPQEHVVTYHLTQADAENNVNVLNLTYCTFTQTTIYASLQNVVSGEFVVVNFTVSASGTSIDIADPVVTINSCDDNLDLIAVYDLSGYTSNASLHLTADDAINNINPISNASAFTLSVSTPAFDLFKREATIGECISIRRIRLTTSVGCNNYNNEFYCESARSLCGALGNPFTNTTNAQPASPDNFYGCLGTRPNPAWFYLPVSQGGNISLEIKQTSFTGAGLDVDFICYGPFDNLTQACSGLTQGNVVGCSYSVAAIENFTIQNAVAGKYYILMVTNFSNQAGYIEINETGNSSNALNCSGLRMNAFLDSNANGIKDNNESGFGLGNFVYEVNNNGTIHNITALDGLYSISDENLANTYDISFNILPQYAQYYTVTTPSYSNVAVQPAQSIVTYYFPVTVAQPYQDLSVYIIPNSSPNPGFTYKNTIVYANGGNQAIPTGTVTFTKNSSVTITNISQAGAVVTPTGFEYTFTNLQPFEIRTIEVTMQVPIIPQVMLGDDLTNSAAIEPSAGDAIIANNTASVTQDVIGSYDPNDKMESRGERIVISEFDENDYLYYTIRFQNTGTAAAQFVRIQDVLNDQLDENTVQMIRSSHNYTLDRIGNTLTWFFNDIMLPPSSVNEPASNGYVQFRVKPLSGFQAGDIIPNTAYIYFDFNPAIITNTFNTEFVTALSRNETGTLSFSIYPNPGHKEVTIQLASISNDAIRAVRVYDVSGKTIFSNENISAATTTIDVEKFGSGAYFVELVTENSNRLVKKLLVK